MQTWPRSYCSWRAVRRYRPVCARPLAWLAACPRAALATILAARRMPILSTILAARPHAYALNHPGCCLASLPACLPACVRAGRPACYPCTCLARQSACSSHACVATTTGCTPPPHTYKAHRLLNPEAAGGCAAAGRRRGVRAQRYRSAAVPPPRWRQLSGVAPDAGRALCRPACALVCGEPTREQRWRRRRQTRRD